MKLRNKKTGEIGEIYFAGGDALTIGTIDNGDPLTKCCDTLTEVKIMLDEWEDYKPAEPLIKDEKIRKAVRAWWDCCQEGIEDKEIYIKDAEFRMGIYRLDLGRYYFFDDKKEGFYTIAELCGEEEE